MITCSVILNYCVELIYQTERFLDELIAKLPCQYFPSGTGIATNYSKT